MCTNSHKQKQLKKRRKEKKKKKRSHEIGPAIIHVHRKLKKKIKDLVDEMLIDMTRIRVDHRIRRRAASDIGAGVRVWCVGHKGALESRGGGRDRGELATGGAARITAVR